MKSLLWVFKMFCALTKFNSLVSKIFNFSVLEESSSVFDKDILSIQKIEKQIMYSLNKIIYAYNVGLYREIGNLYPKHIFTKSFKTESQANKYARAYMRKN